VVVALRLASVAAFLLLWEWAARVPISFNFPSPWATAGALVALVRSGALPAATLISLQSLLLGFGAAVLVGVPLGLVMGVVRTMNAYGGVRDVRPRLVEMARAFDASWAQLFTRIVLPSALPMILAGVRYALSRAFVGLIVAELLLSPFGLGRLIMTTRSMFEHDRMFATVLWTLLFAGAALAALARLEARLLRWRS